MRVVYAGLTCSDNLTILGMASLAGSINPAISCLIHAISVILGIKGARNSRPVRSWI